MNRVLRSSTRLGSILEFSYAEVYSVRLKRFPVSGRVEGVEWRAVGPFELDERNGHFYVHVAEILSHNTAVTDAITDTGVDLEVYIDSDPGSWVICDKEWRTATRQARDCYRTVAEALMAMVVP